MALPLLSRLAQLLLEKRDVALTVTELVQLTPSITDVVYLECSHAAADLYGVEHPHDLIGRYLSQTHLPDDYRMGAILSCAQKLGRANIPVLYTGRLVHPDGTVVSVEKKVERLYLEHGRVQWITFLERIREDPGPPQIDLEALAIPPATLEQFMGKYSVADVEQRLQHQSSPWPDRGGEKSALQKKHPTSTIIQKFHQSSRKDSMEATLLDSDEVFILRKGGVAPLPLSEKRPGDAPFSHAYWCWGCNEIIRCKEENPDRCTRCGSYRWWEKPQDPAEKKPKRRKKLRDQ